MTMKLRNRLIALVCLLLFLGIGAALFLTTTTRKPFAVILFVCDNLTPNNLTAARIFSGGGDARLQMEDLPFSALCRNAANDFSIPESASASTALAAGSRVNRGSLGIDPSGAKLPSLLEVAATKGRSTGLITLGEITGTTAAAYYAKSNRAGDLQDLTQQFYHHPPFDIVIANQEIPSTNSTNTLQDASSAQFAPPGVIVVKSLDQLEKQPFWKKAPLLALFSKDQPSSPSSADGNSAPASLSDLVRLAIRNLQSNSHGYCLVVDDPMIAQAASGNDAESMFKRMLAFDEAVGTARRYAGNNALILVTGRETIGGLNLNGYPFLGDKGVAVLSLNAQGNPSLCWATGPGYSMEAPGSKKSIKNAANTSSPGILSQPSAYNLPQGIGVASDVLCLGSGQGSERLRGFLNLTDIHHLLRDEL